MKDMTNTSIITFPWDAKLRSFDSRRSWPSFRGLKLGAVSGDGCETPAMECCTASSYVFRSLGYFFKEEGGRSVYIWEQDNLPSESEPLNVRCAHKGPTWQNHS